MVGKLKMESNVEAFLQAQKGRLFETFMAWELGQGLQIGEKFENGLFHV